MRVTVLMENTAPNGLACEHGLSLHLDYEGRSCLLDAGHSGRFVENADALGIDLSKVEMAFLSHGHYDHADGFAAFFARNANAPVYLRADARLPQYYPTADGEQFIGVKPALLNTYAARFRTVEGVCSPAPGLHLVPDSVPHEQSLVAETARGLVVFNSCCHAGAGHIVKEILARFPGKQVYALVGGFHLMGHGGVQTLGVEPGMVKNLARWLTDELGVSEIYTGHCTGAPAYALLSEVLGPRLHTLQAGEVIDF